MDDGVIAKASVGCDDGVDGIFLLEDDDDALLTSAFFPRAAIVMRMRRDINRMVLKGLANLWDNGGWIGELGRRAIGYWGWIRVKREFFMVVTVHRAPLCAQVNNQHPPGAC